MHLFYQPNVRQRQLEGEEARHCAKVLRLGPADIIWVTDGKGKLYKASLTQVKEKLVQYTILETLPVSTRPYKVSMVIAPTRKAERNEWMVEKMVELGVDEIHFVLTEHTHHESVRRVVNQERLERIAVAAMKQSQQVMVPDIQVYNDFGKYLSACQQTNRFIAYVTDTDIPPHLLKQIDPGRDIVVLIGPEGDFSQEEIEQAMAAGFRPVSLGETRLRTETAAVMACHSAHLAQLIY
ncbi:16S rRNA (uracil(1498)-N(3))-methyltransferase [Telluribacter sp. SYSU D00476]|uniref:RsmE family RNA methyltransferase n=1 Tax=Telluribacter sp. SYSU D00476 TaxID=2811430 RepID=UPI001FF5D880|nr:16S rRNA (uracil(1498)-N(3))-methyltransferase [Telluribacter sp. SYSU D00476]